MGFWANRRSVGRSNSAMLALSSGADGNAPLAHHAGIAWRDLLQTGSAAATTLMALACLLYDLHRHPLSRADFPLLLVFISLLLVARSTLISALISATRERSLTFTAPLVFGLTVWFGSLLAGLSAFAACWIYARFGTPTGVSRHRARAYTRWQGAQFVLSAYAARVVMSPPPSQPLPATTAASTLPALERLSQTANGAAAFCIILALCYSLVHFASLRQEEDTLAGRAHLARLVGVMTLGLLPIVLLAPLGAVYGAGLGLPLLLLLLLSARVARQQEEIHSLRKQLRASEAMGRASIHDPDVADGSVLLQRFLALAQELVPADRSLVWILDQKSGELTPDIALPNKGPFARRTALFGEGIIGHAAAHMSPRLIEDASKDPHRLPRENVSGAWLLYPIVVHEQLLGVAQWTRALSRPFTSEDTARLEYLVPQAAIALENVYIRAQMHDLAATDGLTGLWNHQRMYDLLREEIQRATRYKRALSVLMMDVDSFKTFNDSYGHPQGDQLLKIVAGILQSSVRNVDHVGRYGGEEFMIVLPETFKDDACRLAERIRAHVEENAWVLVDERPIRRTISIGVAAYPEDALNAGELVQRADEAMYRAKRAGKNRVLWA